MFDIITILKKYWSVGGGDRPGCLLLDPPMDTFCCMQRMRESFDTEKFSILSLPKLLSIGRSTNSGLLFAVLQNIICRVKFIEFDGIFLD